MSRIRLQIRQWRERSRVRRLLAAMSARELQDIGFAHSDIINEIDKPFWRQ